MEKDLYFDLLGLKFYEVQVRYYIRIKVRSWFSPMPYFFKYHVSTMYFYFPSQNKSHNTIHIFIMM